MKAVGWCVARGAPATVALAHPNFIVCVCVCGVCLCVCVSQDIGVSISHFALANFQIVLHLILFGASALVMRRLPARSAQRSRPQ